MSTDDLRSILSKYGIDASDSLINSIPETSYAEEHKAEQDLIPIRD